MIKIDVPPPAFVTIKGLRLSYVDYGNAGAPPALLVHATGFHKELWGPVARTLAPRFHVLALDQRGHGDSDRPPPSEKWHWRNFGDDVVGFLDALDLRGVLAIGHSSGGTAVILAAAARPELVGRAVLVEPVVFPRGGQAAGNTSGGNSQGGDNSMGDRTRKRRHSFDSVEAFVQSFKGRPPFKDWTDEALWTYARYGTAPGPDGKLHLKCPPAIEAQVYETNRSVDPWPALEKMRCPVLYIQAGNRGGVGSPDLAENMRRAIPHLKHVVVPGAGHLVPMEQPQAVIAAIDDFMK